MKENSSLICGNGQLIATIFADFPVQLTITFVLNSASTSASFCTRHLAGSGSRLDAANSASK